jgi:hypothetical protein
MASRVIMALVMAASLGLAMSASTPSLQFFNNNLFKSQVETTQSAWCRALLSISAANRAEGPVAAKRVAERAIDRAYAYQFGPVAFKPTLTFGAQTFRSTRAGALAYFVGQDPNFPNDTGFALNDWRGCEYINRVIQFNGAQATTMGNVILTTGTGAKVMVDKTWGFMRQLDGTVRIMLHHSSLPYNPNP